MNRIVVRHCQAKSRRQLITGLIYPQNAKGLPIYNPFGKYLVKLYINGVQRKVLTGLLIETNAYTYTDMQ